MDYGLVIFLSKYCISLSIIKIVNIDIIFVQLNTVVNMIELN